MFSPEYDVEYLQILSVGSHAVKFKGRMIPRQTIHAITVTRRQRAMVTEEVRVSHLEHLALKSEGIDPTFTYHEI